MRIEGGVEVDSPQALWANGGSRRGFGVKEEEGMNREGSNGGWLVGYSIHPH